MTTAKLFAPCELNGLTLNNRIAMSPVTRARATEDGHVGELQQIYYGQRGDAGLIFTEAVAVTPGGRGGPFLPGLWADSHVAGWRQVTGAVRARGGRIFCQLWHAGRISHSSFSQNGEPPLAASPVPGEGRIFTPQGMVPYETPRAMTLEEAPVVKGWYRDAARRAREAGFDGVELHAAHSYLIDSFLRDMTNRRDDIYGGPVENRVRFVIEVLETLLEVWEPERVAIRIAPVGHAYNAWDSDPEPLFTHLVERLNGLRIGWLDLVEGDTGVSREAEPSFDLQKLRRLFRGVTIVNNLYDRQMAIDAVESGRADMVAFGRAFIGNPDLVRRLEAGAPLNEAPPAVYYQGGAKGYVDFPTLAEQAAAG
ncbi:alkene reductase [Camelimonas abortus]|uniref:Alkene reductase n=1 Tax=Camelimonas abortus TaxID=1017184 RepID=A0ABV7LAY2_9HYPH